MRNKEHLVYLVQVTATGAAASPPLHAAVFAEGTTVDTPNARWYAAQYWCPIIVAMVALKWMTSWLPPERSSGSPAGWHPGLYSAGFAHSGTGE